VGETQAHRSVDPCVSRSAGIAECSHQKPQAGPGLPWSAPRTRTSPTRMRCPWACRSSMATDRAPVQSAMLGEATASAVRQYGGAADELVRVGERRAVRCGMHQSTSHTAGARTRRTVSCTCQQIGGRGSRGVRRQRQRRQRAWAEGRGLGRPQAQQRTAGPPSLRAPAASCQDENSITVYCSLSTKLAPEPLVA